MAVMMGSGAGPEGYPLAPASQNLTRAKSAGNDRVLEVLQHFLRVRGRVHLRIRLLDLAVGADEVADPPGRARAGIVGGAIGQADLALGVAQEREVEAELPGEGGVLLHAVEAGAQDLDALVLVEPDAVAEPATLGRSAGSVRP